MPNIRIKDIPTTASSTSSTDFIGIDGSANGTRKLNAYSPSFGGNATVGGTLTVNGGTQVLSASGGSDCLLVVDQTGTAASYLRLQSAASPSGAFGGIEFKNAGSTRWFIGGQGGYVNSAHDFNVTVNGDYRFRIDTAGVSRVLSTTASSSTSTGALVVSGGVGVAGAINAGGNLTVSGTTGVTATDLVLGTSGPSAKSSIAARAARQGLVFAGTAGAYSSLIAGPSTQDFTLACWVNPASFAASGYLFGNSQTNSIYVGVRVTTGALFSGLSGGSPFGDTGFSLASGKMQLLVRVRSGTTAAWYLNGVLVQSGVSDSNNYSGAFEYYGSANSSAAFFTGTLIPLIYNRALSAAEVVSLYEAGAPSAADYNSASNTSRIATGNAGSLGATDGNATTGWSGFQATLSSEAGARTGGAGSYFLRSTRSGNDFNSWYVDSLAVKVGQRFLLRFWVKGSASFTLKYALRQDGTNLTGASVTQAITTTWARVEQELTIAAAGTINRISFDCAAQGSDGSSYFDLDDVELYSLGLLLAPDAAQPGGGLVWYDTSGNAANITLPASGVSWNVPTSGKINNALSITNTTASTSTSTGALVVSGGVGVAGAIYAGGVIGFAGDTRYGVAKVYNSSTGDMFGLEQASAAQTGDVPATRIFTSSAGNAALDLGKYTSATAFTNWLRIGTNGNVLVNTTTDGGQKFQVSGTGAFSGAISIGNTVNTVSPTSPNRTITMVIGGTTYYIHAKTTND